MELSKRSPKELPPFFIKFSWLGDLVSLHPGVLENILPAEAANLWSRADVFRADCPCRVSQGKWLGIDGSS